MNSDIARSKTRSIIVRRVYVPGHYREYDRKWGTKTVYIEPHIREYKFKVKPHTISGRNTEKPLSKSENEYLLQHQGMSPKSVRTQSNLIIKFHQKPYYRTIREIADRLQISEETVKERLKDSRYPLRTDKEQLERRNKAFKVYDKMQIPLEQQKTLGIDKTDKPMRQVLLEKEQRRQILLDTLKQLRYTTTGELEKQAKQAGYHYAQKTLYRDIITLNQKGLLKAQRIQSPSTGQTTLIGLKALPLEDHPILRKIRKQTKKS